MRPWLYRIPLVSFNTFRCILFQKKNWERTFSGSAVHTTGSTRTLLILPKFIGAKHRDQAKLIKKSSFEAGRLHSKKQLHCVLCTKSVLTFSIFKLYSVCLWFGLLNTFIIEKYICYFCSVNFSILFCWLFTEVSEKICRKVWKTLLIKNLKLHFFLMTTI